MDNTVSVKAEGEVATRDISRTRKFPNVLFGKNVDKVNLREVFVHPTLKTLKSMNPSNQPGKILKFYLILNRIRRMKT